MAAYRAFKQATRGFGSNLGKPEFIAAMERAVELDPDFVQAWAELAGAWNGLAFSSDSATDWERYVAESETAARKAVELDPDLAAAHSALGWVAHRRGERLEAERHFRRALELDPNDLGAMSGLALQLWRDPEAALALLDRMTERERYRTLGLYYSMVSLNFANAIDNYQQLVERFPADGAGNNNLAVLYTMTAQYDRALEQSEQLL